MNCPNCLTPLELEVTFEHTIDLHAAADGTFDMQYAAVRFQEEVSESTGDWSMELFKDIEGFCAKCGRYFDVELDESNWPQLRIATVRPRLKA